ncbi:MAG: L-lactate dehydrogenase [Eubacteriales bacterium]|nr:L-lactate dehydrogenase [Eubacteriales bacterium]
MAVNKRKVAIVGCGRSGSAVSYALMQSGLFSEMVLIDSLAGKADRVALDLAYGISFVKPMSIKAGDYDDLADAGIIVLCAGEPRLKTDTRMEFIRKNVNVLESILPEIAKRNTEGILLVVTNPVDVLTYSALKYIEIPESRILGIGTILDTARIKYLLGNKLSVDPRNVHAFVIGEHGRSEVPIWSSARVSGVPLRDFFETRGYQDCDSYLKQIIKEVRKDAGDLSYRRDDTFFGVAMAARRICEAIVRDEKAVLPVSSLMYGAFDIDGIALSMPAVVGANGVECLVPVEMNENELDEIRKSAATLKSIVDDALGEAR